MRAIIVVIAICLVAACVPISTPPQLDHTPGPAVMVTDRVYDSGLFRLRYPAGWRVITSAASSDPYVIFAAPGDEALIIVALGTAPTPDLEGETYSVERRIDLGEDRQVNAVLHAPIETWMDYRPVFDALVESLS